MSVPAFATQGTRGQRINRIVLQYGGTPILAEEIVRSGVHVGTFEALCRRACTSGRRLSGNTETKIRAALRADLEYREQTFDIEAGSVRRSVGAFDAATALVRATCDARGISRELTAAFLAARVKPADVAEILERAAGPDGRVASQVQAELAADQRLKRRAAA